MQGFAMGLRGEAVSSVAQGQGSPSTPLWCPGQRRKNCLGYHGVHYQEIISTPDAGILSAAEGDSMLVVKREHCQGACSYQLAWTGVETCIAHGSFHEIDIDNMEDQHEEFESMGDSSRPQAATQSPARLSSGMGSLQWLLCGEERILKSSGADIVVTGGQTMNPSIQDIADAVHAARAREVIVRSNNGNVVLTAAGVSTGPGQYQGACCSQQDGSAGLAALWPCLHLLRE